MNDIIVIFLAIFLEALPFLLIGAFLSAIIENMFKENFILNKINSSSIFFYFLASICGIFLPVCECLIIPLTRSFIKKGLPIGVAITFMLSAPIVNPLVMISTYYAFNFNFKYLFLRLFFAIIISIIIGIMMSKEKENILKNEIKQRENNKICDLIDNNYQNLNYKNENCQKNFNCMCKKNIKSKNIVETIILDASNEFLEIVFYFIIGAFISAIFQSYIPKTILINLKNNSLLSIIFMQILAFIMSLCSQADAFIANSFVNYMPKASILAFMIFGAMLDLKNIFMMNTIFKKTFIIKLSLSIVIINFIVFVIYDIILKNV